MRRFHSYGPVEAQAHYCVDRKALVGSCVAQLIGTPEEGGGHYFTIWAPRQTGKTWLMRQAMAAVGRGRPDEFLVGMMSMQGVFMEDDDPPEEFLRRVPQLMSLAFDADVDVPADWEGMKDLFRADAALFDRPVIRLVDEFDNLPQGVIDRLVAMFRDIDQSRQRHCLHAFALIGVRAVMGAESRRGSPFNIQRSIHVPNLTQAEVTEMFDQYRYESGQVVEVAVVDEVFRVTRGQPGLVGWFGELLTEKYNPGREQALDEKVWRRVYQNALHVEPNNTVLAARGNRLALLHCARVPDRKRKGRFCT